MNNLKINHLAVLVCVVLMHVLGFLWYGPLFQEKWMAYVSFDMAKAEANPPGIGLWVMNFVAVVSPLYALAWLFTKIGVSSGVRGAGIALLISFAFHHLPTMSGNMFAAMPYGLAWITGGYQLVAMALSGFILGAWTRKNT